MHSSSLHAVTVLAVATDGSPTVARLPEADESLTVVSVADADEAMERLGAGGVDCVLCEHDPPALDAVELLDVLPDRFDPSPSVVVCTGRDDALARRVLDAGAAAVVERPFDEITPEVLANRVRRTAGLTPDARDAATSTEGKPRSSTGAAGDDALDASAVAELEALSDALRRAGRRSDVASVVADAAEGLLDAPGVGVFLFEDEQNRLQPVAITDALASYYGDDLVFGPGKPDSITWQAFVTGETHAYDDLRTADSHVNPDTDARSSVFAPLGEYGVFVVAADAVGAFTRSDRAVAELLAGMARAALDRVADAATLRERDRDVQRNRRELRRVQRIDDFVRDVVDSVAAAATREEIARAVCDRLTDTAWFDVAWFGTVRDGRIEPEYWTDGASEYLDDVSFDLETCEEPACRCARTREVSAVPNVATTLRQDGWERAAMRRGFHSVLSVPVTYEGVRYGVLTAYADRPEAYDEAVTDAVADVARTAAFGVNAAETRFGLLSTGVTELELRVGDAPDVLAALSSAVGEPVECLELTPQPGGETEVVFTVADVAAERVLATTTGLGGVERVVHVGGDGTHLYRAVVSREPVGSVLARSGAVPTEITADGTDLVVTVTVPENVDARTFRNRIERRYPDAELLARRELDRSSLTRTGFVTELEALLTDRQLEVLRTAYELGFFRSPRDATGQDVADALGVSQPTVSHHLRAGQGRLFSLLFGDLRDV